MNLAGTLVQVSPTQRTLKALKDQGFECGIVERWLSGPGKRSDLFGFIDIICMTDAGVLAVQSTGTDFAGHYKKITQDCAIRARQWIQMPNARLQLWGWRKVKKARGGKLMVYRPRVHEFTLQDFDGSLPDLMQEDSVVGF